MEVDKNGVSTSNRVHYIPPHSMNLYICLESSVSEWLDGSRAQK